MAGFKISEFDTTLQLSDDDVILLARPGSGNGHTYKINASVFGKASDATGPQNRVTDLETRVTALENGKVFKTGDTMTGKLTLDGAPEQPLHAATKNYVDQKTLLVKTWASRKC
jgi:hypothetical protein